MLTTRQEMISNMDEYIVDEGAFEVLKEYLDEVESEVKEIMEKLDVKSLSDLANIEEAHDQVRDLAENLF